MSFFKKYWWIIPIAILIPIIVNIILSISTPFTVYENSWLGFWGSYLGALFPFIILYLSLRDNHDENEKGRRTQTAAIIFQVSKEYLNRLKQNIAEYIKALDFLEIEMITLKPKEDVQISLNKIYLLLKESESAYQLLCLTLADYNDDTENKYKDFIRKFNSAYKELLSDITWLLDGEWSLDFYRDHAIKNGNVTIERIRIWKVIEDCKFDITSDSVAIMHELLDRFEYHAIYIKSQDFIVYEKNKMNRTLDVSLYHTSEHERDLHNVL